MEKLFINYMGRIIMNENINIDVKENDTTSSSTTNVNTHLVGISVKTEANNLEKNSQSTAVTCESEKISISLSKWSYWQWLFNEIFSFSTLLFIVAIGSILVLAFADSLKDKVLLEIIIAIFALLSLIFSVVTRVRNDDAKWIKRPLLKSIINGLNSKELNKESLENLLKILEM